MVYAKYRTACGGVPNKPRKDGLSAAPSMTGWRCHLSQLSIIFIDQSPILWQRLLVQRIKNHAASAWRQIAPLTLVGMKGGNLIRMLALARC